MMCYGVMFFRLPRLFRFIPVMLSLLVTSGRHCLRSSSSHRLQVPSYSLATVGRRSFPIAASILWNRLPPNIQDFILILATNFGHTCSTNHFQTFCYNYPHIDFAFVDFVMTPVILATLKIRI